MTIPDLDLRFFFQQHHPFDSLPDEAIDALVADCTTEHAAVGERLYVRDHAIQRLCVLESGQVDLISPQDEIVFRYAAGDTIGVRGLLRDGLAADDAVVREAAKVICIPKPRFEALLADYPTFSAFYDRNRATQQRAAIGAADPAAALLTTTMRDVMTPDPVAIGPDAPIGAAARLMRSRRISCLLVADEDGRLAGMVTTADMTARVVAEELEAATPVSAVMSVSPRSLGPDSTVLDAVLEMSERNIGHLPVLEADRIVGIVTRTNLIHRNSLSAAGMVRDIGRQSSVDGLKQAIARLPQALAQMVGSGFDVRTMGQMITNLTDVLTRRLLALAQETLGPPPVPYLWMACGSQGRQEQTGLSDQDNVLILDESYEPAEHGAYFEALARRVSDGLNACGFVYCPGDMMATNPKWRERPIVWRSYFRDWIDRPDPKAQMLASVMFDLRPISGTVALFDGIRADTLDRARRNSLFRAHLIANSLKHVPPLNLFRGFALIRSGEHKNTVDMKMNGVVPIVDLARVFALDAGVEAVNTRDRLVAAREAGSLSAGAAEDLVAAYDLIGRVRLEHQARMIRQGEPPNNFLAPSTLSALERNHLKDAFNAIKSLQSALGQVRGVA